jgi:hypothetical protein
VTEKVLESRSVTHQRLSPDDWGKICSLPWSEMNQRIIGRLLTADGNGLADDILEGRIATARRISRFFAAHELPYRLQRYWLPREQWPDRADRSIQRQGVRIVTLTKKL